ncbi:MAG: beta-ketoacyl synthase N-terminal-like domain-containing protein, partial [Halobacteriovoraceae bacterium]|nr:beta-ketoacyl synthase N-terminal-like domain-containing protein [Halobacteriovoraceae bacterium]
MAKTNKYVAVTGMGAVCGLGHNLKDIWNKLIEGVSGISKIESVEVGDLPVQIAGEVKNFQLSEEALPFKEHSRYDKFIHFALQAACEAWNNCGLVKDSVYSQEKMGCILGVGIGGFNFIESNYFTLQNKGPRRVPPFFIPGLIPNMASGAISIRWGLKGVSYTLSSACASAGHAISAACDEIMSGRHTVMISGGAESTISRLPLVGFSNMKALSRSNATPQEASRPFDMERNGFVMGEGAGVMILEDGQMAEERGATIYAEIK